MGSGRVRRGREEWGGCGRAVQCKEVPSS
jgi:hypothetical protein